MDLAALEEQVHALRLALEETQRANRALAQDKKSTSAKELQHRRDVLKQDLWKALREQTDLKKALSRAAAELALGRSTLDRAEETVARTEADLRRAQAQQVGLKSTESGVCTLNAYKTRYDPKVAVVIFAGCNDQNPDPTKGKG